MNLTPDGKRLFVANEETDTIVGFDVDQASGALAANGQVIKTGIDGNSEVNAALQFLFGGKKLLKQFKVKYASEKRAARYGDADHYVLQLKPNEASKHYKGIVLVVHATTGRVDSFVVYNTDGSSNYFQLKGIKTNVGLSDKLFDFKVPKNYVETEE